MYLVVKGFPPRDHVLPTLAGLNMPYLFTCVDMPGQLHVYIVVGVKSRGPPKTLPVGSYVYRTYVIELIIVNYTAFVSQD